MISAVIYIAIGYAAASLLGSTINPLLKRAYDAIAAKLQKKA